MPILDLKSDLLETRPALAYVEAVMLYPNDPDRRDRAIRGAEVLYMLDFIRDGGSPPADDVRQALETALALPALEVLMDEGRRYSTFGTIAGNILHHLLAADERGESDTFSRVRTDMTDPNTDIGRACHRERISKRQVEKIWDEYRSVAHFYSARQALHHAANGAPVPFPCGLRHFPYLLALAERDRKAGEALQLQRSKKTALPRGKAWRVPDEIILPELPDV